MWIDCKTSLPLRIGRYRVLLELDEMGTLSESKDHLFNGKDWDRFESSCQFISHWWGAKQDYVFISAKREKELEEYQEKLKQEVDNPSKPWNLKQ